MSYGFNERHSSSSNNEHGTRCSGIVAAVKDNGICGVGVAHECNLGSKLE